VLYIDAGVETYTSVYLNKNIASTYYAGQFQGDQNNI
jgi:hypothetical protein